MRVLLSTIGSRGDVQPLVALALELRARGHQAAMCVPPDFRGWIEGLGFPVTPVGPEVRATAAAPRPANPIPPSPEQMRRLMDATVAGQLAAIAAAARGCEVIVGATALQFAAHSVAEQMGIPYVFAAYCPNVLPSRHHQPPPYGPPAPASADNAERWGRNAASFNDLALAPINAQRAAAGLGPIADVRSHMFTDQPWLAADPLLGPWPDPAEPVFQPGAWVLPDTRPLPPEVDAFLDDDPPPIFFGFGSVGAPRDFVAMVTAAARQLGRRAIVSRGWSEVADADADAGALVIGEANLLTLFPRVAAIVHHGGAGTTTLASMSGAPQVVVPQVYDQHYWARRVETLGVGIAHAPGAPTTESLTTALRAVLRDDVAARARSIAAMVRRDGAQVAAQRLCDATLTR